MKPTTQKLISASAKKGTTGCMESVGLVKLMSTTMKRKSAVNLDALGTMKNSMWESEDVFVLRIIIG